MTTTMVPDESVLVTPSYRAPGFSDVLRAEWTKARAVPSTMWTLIVAAVLGIGLGALISGVAATHYANSPSTHPNWDPTSISNSGLSIAQLAIGDAPISCQVLSWSSGVKTAGSTFMSHSNPRACSYQAARFDECEPQPWVGESPESQPAKGDSIGVSQTHGQGVSREGDVDRPRGRCSASRCG